MDESDVRALLERMADTEAPPSRVDAGLAREQGLRRLRWRRAGAAGAPVLAAGVAAAVVLGLAGVVPWPGRGTGPAPGRVTPVGQTPAAGGTPTAGQTPAVYGTPRVYIQPAPSRVPHLFDPLAPYAAFGWLPGGTPLAASSDQSMRTVLALSAGSQRAGYFSLRVWAPGTCNLTAGQISRDLRTGRPRGGPPLSCMDSPTGGWQEEARHPGPEINGRPGFWLIYGELAWEYAPQAWAVLGVSRGSLHDGGYSPVTMAKIAASVQFGGTAPAVKLPYQLIGLPPGWQVTSVQWRVTRGGLLGQDLSAGLITDLRVSPAHGNGGCPLDPATPYRRFALGGTTAFVNYYPGQGGPPYRGLCAANVDGLSVGFLLRPAPGTRSLPPGGAIGIFRYHLRLLGRDPAHWTARPLG